MKKVLCFFIILSFIFILNGKTSIKKIDVENQNKSFRVDNQVIPIQGDVLSVSNRILVKYKKQPESCLQVSIRTQVEVTYGVKAIDYFPFIDVYLYETYLDREFTLREIEKDPNIQYAEDDYIVFADSTIPNDSRFSNLWGMHNTGQSGGTVDADIDAPEAWDFSTGSSSVIVAVIDTGVDYNHQDLQGNMWTNSAEIPSNGVDDDSNGYVDDYYGINAYANDGDPMDDNDHGSHCSGTVAAVGNNAIGVVGVCWSAKIMALKFLTSEGLGYTSDAIECIQYGTNKGAHVMSNSWGGGGYSQALKDAIEAAKDAGILFMAAAGNDGLNNDIFPHYPSSYNSANIIAVTATNRKDRSAYFSNYGVTSVDVGAPGVSIQSTILNDSYATWDGTSMATPHVAGLAALIKSYGSSLSWQEIKNAILNNVDQISSLAGKVSTGGRINACNSLSSCVPPSPPALVSPANGSNQSGTSITFSWNAALGATEYILYIVSSSGAASDYWVGDVTSYQVSGFPDDGTQYSWKVYPRNASGNGSPSETWTFTNGTAQSPPSAPTLVSPANGSTQSGASITFSWTVSQEATSYNLNIQSSSGTFFDAWVGNVTTYQVSSFPDNGTQYSWKVYAKNAAGTGSPSETWTFTNGTAQSPPTVPTLISPANGSTQSGTSITFSWNASQGATSYILYIESSSGAASDYWVGNVTSYQVSGFPNDGTQYSWKVYPRNASGNGSPSETWTFTNGTAQSPPTVPTLVSPANGSTQSGTSITFSWNASQGATSYILYIESSSGAASDYWVGNVTSYQVSGFPDDGTQYSWKVYPRSASRNGSPSETWTFTNGTAQSPPTVPTLVSPANGSTQSGTSITFSWNASQGTTEYILYIESSSGKPSDYWVGNVTSYQVSGFPDDGTQYSWKVYPRSASGIGSPSETWTFTNGKSP